MDGVYQEVQILECRITVGAHRFPRKQEIRLWMRGQGLLKAKQKKHLIQISAAQAKFKLPHNLSFSLLILHVCTISLCVPFFVHFAGFTF